MIVDTHVHLLDHGHWPTEWWEWVADDWARKAEGRQAADIVHRIESGLVDPDGSRMLATMDRAGVDTSVILPIDWGTGFTGTKPIDEVVQHALQLSSLHPEKFVAFGGIDPRRPEAAEMVRTWFAAGARGLKLYPSCGWHPASDEAGEVYALANKDRRPVLFHTGDPLPLLDRTYSNPSLLREVAASFPDMPIWLGHAGAHRWWNEALELAGEFNNVRLEMSVWIWNDSSEADRSRFFSHIAQAVKAVGPDKILFGSDNVSGSRVRPDGFLSSIVDTYLQAPERLAELDVLFTAEDLEKIMGGNALRDLGLSLPGADSRAG